MTHHVFTRQALYDQIWTEPMRTVALGLGVSDVGLAKACRVADIPVPPRGYWAKLQHGKPVPARPPLPVRPAGQDRVVIAPPTPRPAPPPEVQTAIETALAEIAEVPVPDDLRRAHPIVRGWLDRNAEQRREWRRMGWGLSGLEDLTTPLTRRRLHLTSALLKALAARGLDLGEDREWLTVGRGEDRVGFRLYGRSKIVHRPATAEELRWRPERKTVRATEPTGDLVLKVRDWLSIPTEYKELKASLESQLPVIVANLEAGVAEQAQRRQARALERERWEAAETVRKKQAAYRQAEQGLVERLVDQAGRRQKAEAVRAYVRAADASPVAAAKDYAGWRDWALAAADALDPLLDGSAPFERLAPIEDWNWRGW